DVALRLEFQLFLDFDLDPQALAIKAVLMAQFVAGHRLVALVSVLVGASPGVVYAHRVVGGNRPVEKRPLRLAAILFAQFVERAGALPELENGPLLGRKIDLSLHLVERHKRNLAEGMRKRYPIISRGGAAGVRMGVTAMNLLCRNGTMGRVAVEIEVS